MAVNTPADGVTHEASDASNSYKALPATVNFVNKVEHILKHNHPVTVADIRFGNGADNALVKTLFDKQRREAPETIEAADEVIKLDRKSVV